VTLYLKSRASCLFQFQKCCSTACDSGVARILPIPLYPNEFLRWYTWSLDDSIHSGNGSLSHGSARKDVSELHAFQSQVLSPWGSFIKGTCSCCSAESRTVRVSSFLDYGLTSWGSYILIDSSTVTVDIVDICHVHDRLQRRVQYSKIMVSPRL